MFRIIIKIIVEILVAICLFIILVKYTPLFDNILKTEVKTSTYQNIEVSKNDIKNMKTDNVHWMTVDIDNVFVQKIQKQLELQKNPENNLYELKTDDIDWTNVIISDLNNIDQIWQTTKSDSFFENTDSWERKKCDFPWSNEKIPDGMHIISYQEQHSDDENICVWEIRICDDWHLLGWYQYPNCTYTIDWINDWEEKIEGATQTNHTLFTFIKWSEYKKEYIQPSRYDYPNKEKPSFTYNLNGHRVNVLKNEWTTNRVNWEHSTDKYSVEEVIWELWDTSLKDCYDWNWNIVKQGEYIITYKNNRELAPKMCMFQKRFCNNGVLEWNWENSTCIQYRKTNTETDTFIEYQKEGEIINVPRLDVLNEFIEPSFVNKIETWTVKIIYVETWVIEEDPIEEEIEICEWECYIENITEIKFEEICKQQHIKITDAYFKNICLDRSCYELITKLILKIENNDIKTWNLELTFLWDNNEILWIQKKEIWLIQSFNSFEYWIMNWTESIDLKIEYSNLCRKNIVEESVTR